MANAHVKRDMINMGSSVDILYLDAFQKLGLTDKDLISLTFALIGFTGDSVSPLGVTIIPITFGEELKSKTLMVSFMMVGLPSAYNAIVNGDFKTREEVMVKYLAEVHQFRRCIITKVSRYENSQADALARLTSSHRTGNGKDS
ncbi:hypothetical protein B296_00031386 [Ensete ventricosum]|uniref:RNase H type-1 domain-containing protein n=1 Tax=Ensete ventricosum TaxID=4639 RepID=A0A426Y4N9_ENSVE|nr:hypothetical protein B296_00031386 [Ensete ventricosum]